MSSKLQSAGVNVHIIKLHEEGSLSALQNRNVTVTTSDFRSSRGASFFSPAMNAFPMVDCVSEASLTLR